MLPEGIYLKVKKSVRGTGHTTRVQSSRFFYALRPINSEMVELCLLDETEKLRPTGLKEQVPWTETKDLQHVPKLQAFFEKLKPALGQPPKPPASEPAVSAQAAQPAAKSKAKPAKPKDEPKEEGGWWDMTSPGSNGIGKKVF